MAMRVNMPHMLDMKSFGLFFGAALLLAITPGPGIFYVLARSLAGGRKEGMLSSLGTFVGGLFHVVAAAIGLSALLAASAFAFQTVRYAGAAYLIYLGIRMIRSRHQTVESASAAPATSTRAFSQGIWTEVLNPKTALFFLAFIPQFVHPASGRVFLQFTMLGAISVALNTGADLVVANFAGLISEALRRNPRAQARQRTASGFGMVGLGIFVAASGTTHSK